MNLQNKNSISLIILFLALSVQIGVHFNRFYVPESDFFDYRAKAISLRQLEIPENFKRPPLYPALIALFSIPFRGPFREQYAADLIMALSAVLSLLFVYRISFRFFGKQAFWLAWLFALHPTTLRMALKPKPEMLVTMLILWAMDRFLRGDRKAYLIAFLATMVRYEGAIAVLAFGTVDFFVAKKRISSVLYSLAAGLPLVLWTLLHSEGSGGGAYGNYFNAYKPNFMFLHTFWDGLLRFLPVQLFTLWVFIGFIMLTAGIVYGLKRFVRETTVLLVFLAGFVVMHIIWPFSNIDYVVIFAWAAFLLMALSLNWLRPVGDKIAAAFQSTPGFVAGSILLAMSIGLVLFYRFPYPQYNIDPLILAVFLVPVIFYLLSDFSRWPIVIWCIAAAVLFGFLLNSKTNADYFDIKYSKAEFRMAGEWFEANREPGEKMAIAQPTVAAYTTKLDPEADFVRLTDIPQGDSLQVHQWLVSNEIDFIAWLSTNKVYDEGDAWYSWKRDNRGWRTIRFLEDGKDHQGFKKIHEIRVGPRWGFIYRILRNDE